MVDCEVAGYLEEFRSLGKAGRMITYDNKVKRVGISYKWYHRFLPAVDKPMSRRYLMPSVYFHHRLTSIAIS